MADVEAQCRAPVQAVAVGRVQAPKNLFAVRSVALQLGVREGQVDVKRPIHLTGGESVLQEAAGAGLTAQLREAGKVDFSQRTKARFPTLMAATWCHNV